MTIRRDSRVALFEHPPATVTFPALRLGRAPVLRTACGLKQACWRRVRSAVVFDVLVDAGDGPTLLRTVTST